MDFSTQTLAHAAAITELFEATFVASEGRDQGALIGALATRLIRETPAEDLRVVSAWDRGELLGAIFFTRLSFPNDSRCVFMLSPVAVATAHQGMGVGQRLISHGLDLLRKEGVDIVVTYGDPAYYGRVGFRPVAEVDLPAPQPLSMPEGWIAQSLTDVPLTRIKGPSRCVAAFDDPALW